eukprot:g9308.t1
MVTTSAAASTVPSGGDASKEPAPAYDAISQQAPQLPPYNHMHLAWFSCLCCCWPLGLFAIYKACAVHDHFADGNFERANEAAKTARNASIVAILLGITLFVVNAVFYGSEAGRLYYGEETNT